MSDTTVPAYVTKITDEAAQTTRTSYMITLPTGHAVQVMIDTTDRFAPVEVRVTNDWSDDVVTMASATSDQSARFAFVQVR